MLFIIWLLIILVCLKVKFISLFSYYMSDKLHSVVADVLYKPTNRKDICIAIIMMQIIKPCFIKSLSIYKRVF